jgi:hypothetical protein
MKQYNYACLLVVLSCYLQAAPAPVALESAIKQWEDKSLALLMATPLPKDREWCTNRWEDAFSDVWVLNGRKTSRKKYLDGIAKEVDGGRKALEEVRDDKNGALAALLQTELEAVRQTGREQLEENINGYVRKQHVENYIVYLQHVRWWKNKSFTEWERKGLNTFKSWREASQIPLYKSIWITYPAQHVVLCYKIARAQHQKKLLDTLFPPKMTKP